MRTLSLSVASALVLLSVACGGSSTPASGASSAADTSATAAAATAATPATTAASKPDSDKVTWKSMAGTGKCHVSSQLAAGADLAGGVTAMGTACATGLKQLGATVTGAGGTNGQMVQTIPLHAKANHCYRVFGLAEATVTDFDIAVLDSAGKSAGEDGTDSRDSVVLEDGAICFKVDDEASVNAAVATGSGKWAVEIWSDAN
jgi:hypothetical protein